MYVVYAAGQFAYEDPLVGILGRVEWHSALLCNSHKIWNTDTAVVWFPHNQDKWSVSLSHHAA